MLKYNYKFGGKSVVISLSDASLKLPQKKLAFRVGPEDIEHFSILEKFLEQQTYEFLEKLYNLYVAGRASIQLTPANKITELDPHVFYDILDMFDIHVFSQFLKNI